MPPSFRESLRMTNTPEFAVTAERELVLPGGRGACSRLGVVSQ
jgi:hypothetical protein